LHLALSPHGYVNFILSPGQRQDMAVFHSLSSSWPWQLIRYVIGDKGYECYKVRKEIRDHGCTPVIPPKQNRLFPGTYDKMLYRTRHHIERFFSHLKENKRLANRYDKLDCTFTAFICCGIMKMSHLLC